MVPTLDCPPSGVTQKVTNSAALGSSLSVDGRGAGIRLIWWDISSADGVWYCNRRARSAAGALGSFCRYAARCGLVLPAELVATPSRCVQDHATMMAVLYGHAGA